MEDPNRCIWTVSLCYISNQQNLRTRSPIIPCNSYIYTIFWHLRNWLEIYWYFQLQYVSKGNFCMWFISCYELHRPLICNISFLNSSSILWIDHRARIISLVVTLAYFIYQHKKSRTVSYYFPDYIFFTHKCLNVFQYPCLMTLNEVASLSPYLCHFRSVKQICLWCHMHVTGRFI